MSFAPPPRPACPHCGAEQPGARPLCWLCGSAFEAGGIPPLPDRPELVPRRPPPPPAPERERREFSQSTWLVFVSLVAATLGAFFLGVRYGLGAVIVTAIPILMTAVQLYAPAAAPEDAPAPKRGPLRAPREAERPAPAGSDDLFSLVLRGLGYAVVVIVLVPLAVAGALFVSCMAIFAGASAFH